MAPIDQTERIVTTRPENGRAWSAEPGETTGSIVEVTTTIQVGRPDATTVSGLTSTQPRELRDRIRAATRNSGQQWPDGLVHVDLAPPALPKQAAAHDLAAACSVLTAAGFASVDLLRRTLLLGELGLDGGIRRIPGIASRLRAARHAGLTRAIVPSSDLGEAAVVTGIEILGASRLTDVVAWMNGHEAALTRARRAINNSQHAAPAEEQAITRRSGEHGRT